MRAVARFLVGVVRFVGWTAFVLVAVLFLAEETGALAGIAQRVIASRLAAGGERVRIDGISIGWFEPSLQVTGLQLDRDGESLRLEETTFRFDPRNLVGGRPLRGIEVEVRGGRIRFSQDLLDWIQGASSGLPEARPEAARTWAAPAITLRDVEIDLDTRRFGRIPIGRVDVVVRNDPTGPPVLRGRLVPSLSSSPEGSGEIFLSGQEFVPGGFDLQASAAGIPISTDYLPAGTEIEGLRAYAPRGVLALQAEGSFRLDGTTPPRANVRLTLADAELEIAQRDQRIDRLRLELQAEYAPPSANDLLTLTAWKTEARLVGRWQGVPFEVMARGTGPEDHETLASCRLHVPQLPATHEILELVGSPSSGENLWQALDPRGEVELWLGLRMPRVNRLDEPLGKGISAAAEIGMSGDAGLTYRGWTSGATGQRDQGFPLPVDHVNGSVIYAFDPTRLRPALVGIASASARPERGTARVMGIIASHPENAPPYLPGHGYAELDLHIRAEGIPVDEKLLSALRGLSGAVPPDESWEPFAPQGGEVSADLRILRQVEMEYAAVRLALDLQGMSATWKAVPAPISGVKGRLEFVSDGHSERGLGASFLATCRTSPDLRMTIRYQTDPSTPVPPEGKPRLDQIALVSVKAGRISLNGDDKKILAAKYDWLREAMDPHAPRGFADVAYDFIRVGPDAIARTDAEVTALEAELTPSAFPVNVTHVRGRVIVTAVEETAHGETRSSTRLAPLVGQLPGDVVVSVTGSFPEGVLAVAGAGLDPANKSLLGALGQALPKPEGSSGVDLAAVAVEGPLDVTGQITLPNDSEEARLVFRLFLRENSLQTSKSFRLDRMRGILEVRDRSAYGQRIEASLGGTPLDLKDLRYTSTPDGFEFVTEIGPADNIPLDRDHLAPFVDEKTLDALLGPLGWRGRIDVAQGHVRIIGSRQNETRVEFRGKLTPSDMRVQLGLPLEVRSASADIEQLIFEGGRVRAVCRIEELYGTIAGRDLAKTSMLLTYVEPRLSIESIQGEFEGGEIRTLGGGAERGGTAFTIDLEEPFPFQLALDLHGLQLAGLLRGLFATNFATRGLLDCRLRLTGDTQRMLGIQGSGFVQMRDTRLWSVPVFRALFSQLGLDDQAVFDNMGANLRIKNGILYTDDIWVSSPILELVGKGWVDFDGGVKQDLQVRYRLIDRLGPLTRILYAIQKELLSIAIRGDLAGPRVILKAPWTSVSSDTKRYRSLPLPGFTPLPARF